MYKIKVPLSSLIWSGRLIRRILLMNTPPNPHYSKRPLPFIFSPHQNTCQISSNSSLMPHPPLLPNDILWRHKSRYASLTLILLTSTIWRAPTNASKWRMGFNSAFKGLINFSSPPPYSYLPPPHPPYVWTLSSATPYISKNNVFRLLISRASFRFS